LHVLPDDRPGLGPLGGIATALRVSSCPWNLVLGCDLPYLTGPWLDFLMRRALASTADALLPETARGPEPLCAMYHRRCLASILAAIERNNLKITHGLSACVVESIAEAEWKAFDSDGRLFKNMNAPADYEEARTFFEGKKPR
jgi:molybdopterin-guanine dinucleotide biosynthesis protein A